MDVHVYVRECNERVQSFVHMFHVVEHACARMCCVRQTHLAISRRPRAAKWPCSFFFSQITTRWRPTICWVLCVRTASWCVCRALAVCTSLIRASQRSLVCVYVHNKPPLNRDKGVLHFLMMDIEKGYSNVIVLRGVLIHANILTWCLASCQYPYVVSCFMPISLRGVLLHANILTCKWTFLSYA